MQTWLLEHASQTRYNCIHNFNIQLVSGCDERLMVWCRFRELYHMQSQTALHLFEVHLQSHIIYFSD